MIRKTFIFVLFSIIIISCDKDKKVTDKLDGVWSIDKKTYTDPGTVYEPAGTFTFHDCVQDSCSGILVNENEITVEFDWYVTALGTTITITSKDANGFLVKGIYTIESIKKEKLKMSYEQLGQPISFEMTRIADV